MARFVGLTIIVITTVVTTDISQAQSSPGLGRSGRWLTYHGTPTYFVGYDCQELACDPTINITQALDLFVTYRINKVRIWAYCYWNPAGFLHPWPYANGKFNLDQWNASYWSRVRGFVAAARSRNIIVEYTLFAPNNVDSKADWTSTTSRPAWNEAYNTNGAFASNASGHFSPQFFTLSLPETSSSGKRLQTYQQALVDKSVQELGGFDNLYFEICNEFPVQNASIDSVYPWQLHWAERVASASPRLVTTHAHQYVGAHTTGIQYFWSQPSVDILNFHGGLDPNNISALMHAAQTRGKVLQNNEGGDPYLNLDLATRNAWGWFLAGGHYSLYEDDSSRIGSSGWRSGASRLKVIRDIADSVEFSKISPVDAAGNEVDGLITQGPALDWQVMASPGSAYLAYWWGTPRTTAVSLAAPSGGYDFEWRDARNGSLLGSGTVTSNGRATIASPSTTSWNGNVGLALIVRARKTGFAAKINFQLQSAATVSGYTPDYGQVYGSRNGMIYGWNADHTDVTRWRNLHPVPLLDRLCHFHAGAKWELSVPNGTYVVTVSVGDPQYASQNTIRAEGVTFWSNLALGVNQYGNQARTVAVSDGRLTLDNGSNPDKSTKINYVEVRPAP